MFKLTTISLLLFLSTGINILVTMIAWRRKNSKAGMLFAWGMAAITLWTAASALDYAAVSIPLKVFFAKVELTSYTSGLSLFVAFTLSYVGNAAWLKKSWVKILLIAAPLSNTLLAWTNDWHNWLWTGFSRASIGDNIVLFHHGPAFVYLSITGYISTAIILYSLWGATRRGSTILRKQARLLFFASVIPLFGNLLYVLDIEGVRGIDWASILFTFSGFFFLAALYSTRLFNLVPIARHTMIEWMNDIVLVLDHENRLVDFNLAARVFFGLNDKNMGVIVQSAMARWPQILTLVTAPPEQTIPLEMKLNKQIFDIRLTLLENTPGQTHGKMIVLRNITQRHRAEQKMAEQFVELSELHENLRQTQSQLVEQQRTLAIIEERQRLGRDMHDSVNQSIHSIMLFAETLKVMIRNDQPEEALQIAERIQLGGRRALKEIRLLLYEIQSPLADENADLIAMLKERLEMVEARVDIKTEVLLHGDRIHLPSAWNENLYWLATEALNNALKHAQANSIQVIFTCAEELLTLEIKDNGVGFSPEQMSGGGLGMRTMRERAALMDGELEISSTPGEGTLISFSAATK